MRYFGSKSSTLESLGAIVDGRFEGGTFADPFGGVGVVGSYFRQKGYLVSSGDLLRFPVAFQVARLSVSKSPEIEAVFSEVLEDIQASPNIGGWVTRYYSEGRSYFTRENAIAIDSAYAAVHRRREDPSVTTEAFAFLLASLISSADRVANTAGTYYAHLKSWDRRALKSFEMKPIAVPFGPLGCAKERDALETVRAAEYDIVYLDPPYNTRDYAAYYHFPEALAEGENAPSPRGRSGVNQNRIAPSRFAARGTASSAMQELLQDVRAKLLLLHYRDDGLVQREDLRRWLSSMGRLREHSIDALGYGTRGERRCIHRVYEVQMDA